MANRSARLITKRTSVPGKIPTGTTGTELNFIRSGELASNLADKKLFGFDGTDVFEYGSNSFLSLSGGVVNGDVNVSGSLSANTFYSGSTDLETIIKNLITSDADTFVQPGVNTFTGGTPTRPTVNLVSSPSIDGLTASGTSNFTGVIQSGGTDLYDIFLTSADGNDITRVQPGTNITTGGTANNPIVNLDNNISLTSLSADTIYSGSTDLYDIFSTTDYYVTGGTFSAETLTLNRNDGQDVVITGVTQERQILDVYQSGTTSVGGTFTDIDFDSQIIVDSDYLFTSGTIEFNSTGYYEVDYSISLDVNSGGRKTARHRLVLDEGSGFNEIIRSVSFSYHRNNSSGKGSASKKIRQLFNAGDVIKLQSEIESGGGSLISVANASNITINKISS